MRQPSFRKYILFSQLGLWLIFFMIYFLEEMSYSATGLAFLYALCYTLLHVVPVYVHYYVLLPILQRGKAWIYWSSTLLLLILAGLALRGIDLTLPFTYTYDVPLFSDLIYNLLLLVLVVAVSSMYYFVEAWIENFQTQSLLRSEKLDAELSFLKSQINPHFLFNTLNNIYSYVQTNNEKAAPMLERLSSILRFIVYDGRAETVTLAKELETVHDLVEIHRIKNPTYNNIRLSIEGVKGYHLVPPLLIINIVENACKHSDATSNEQGFIDIAMKVDDENRFDLSVSNSIKERVLQDPEYQGVGLENLKRRLALLFPHDHRLEEQKTDQHYQLKLNFPLTRKD
ncbi:MAG: histidine kinase [Bacteroidota bacterium]